jgi:hypothetical protein
MTVTPRTLCLAIMLATLATGAYATDWSGMLKSILQSPNTGSAAQLTEAEMTSGLKEALAVGVERAINGLARPGGYLNDPAVRIPLPSTLERAEKTLRTLGQGKAVDEFIATVNGAAENAVPQGAEIVGDAIRGMTIADAQKLLNGGDDAATQYFREKTWNKLAAAMLPIVQKATAQAGVTGAYKNMVSRAGPAASLLGDSADLDGYVTGKTLEGLFVKLADEERAIRQNPVARSTDLLKKVFGSR